MAQQQLTNTQHFGAAAADAVADSIATYRAANFTDLEIANNLHKAAREYLRKADVLDDKRICLRAEEQEANLREANLCRDVAHAHEEKRMDLMAKAVRAVAAEYGYHFIPVTDVGDLAETLAKSNGFAKFRCAGGVE